MIRLGTRASALARVQAAQVAEGLRRFGLTVEVVPVRTEGDRLADARLSAFGGKGLFVRELQAALAAGRIDAAVHSVKDLPAEAPAGLELAAFLPREDPRDVVVTADGRGFEGLPTGAVVGTSSLRRRAFALALRPDLVIEPVRGNVDTRLRKLREGQYHALVLAAAGLRRLGLQVVEATPLPVDRWVPAVGQGIVGVEVRADDRQVRQWVAMLDHPPTRVCALAERAFLRELGASCATAMAGYATLDQGRLAMTAVVASEDGRRLLRAEVAGHPGEAEALGRELAASLLARGAATVTGLQPGRVAP